MRSVAADQQIDQMCALLARGNMSFDTIAARLGLTRSGVAARVDRLRKAGDPRIPVIRKGRKDGASGAVPGRRRHREAKGLRGPIILGPDHPAVKDARPLFAGRVFEADHPRIRHVLVDGCNSRKIGGLISKGPKRGWPIYTLTLPERSTCPRSCTEWASCYGNNSNWALRIAPGEAFEERLIRELVSLQSRHPQGFLVRLHVLGDFYSVDYVRLWDVCLAELPALHVFGFTARHSQDDPIGKAIRSLAFRSWDRFSIRFSGMEGSNFASRVVEGDATDAAAVMCPQQTGATAACSTCGLCFAPDFTRSIAFRRH